jgi:hypothetical protein
MPRIRDRLKHAWNVFWDEETHWKDRPIQELGASSSWRPDRTRYRYAGDKTIISSIYTRLAIDVTSVPIFHVRLNDNGQFQEEIESGLQECLTVEANIDQAASAFRQDIVQSLFDWGVVAVVPVNTTLNPWVTGGYDVTNLRVGRIIAWYPKHVRVALYNEDKGLQQEVTVPKAMTAIIENPLYTVMNEPSSTLQRLLRKLALLDAVDEQSASGKLDIIIQLPYVIKTEGRRQEAEKRMKEIEFQLKGSQYGIAYTDGTEKVTQLNRPAENNLMNQIEFLTKMLYSQLGLTDEVMNGTADEAAMINYFNRSIEPILTALTEAMTRSFLTKTARSQGQAVIFLRNPFKLVPVVALAEIVDKFTRNAVASSNEFRSIIGWKPSSDPDADKLINKNLPQPGSNPAVAPPQKPLMLPMRPQTPPIPRRGATSQNGS